MAEGLLSNPLRRRYGRDYLLMSIPDYIIGGSYLYSSASPWPGASGGTWDWTISYNPPAHIFIFDEVARYTALNITLPADGWVQEPSHGFYRKAGALSTIDTPLRVFSKLFRTGSSVTVQVQDILVGGVVSSGDICDGPTTTSTETMTTTSTFTGSSSTVTTSTATTTTATTTSTTTLTATTTSITMTATTITITTTRTTLTQTTTTKTVTTTSITTTTTTTATATSTTLTTTTTAPVISVHVTVHNVDYSGLTSDDTAASEFKAVAKTEFANILPGGVGTEWIEIILTQGSVDVEAFITIPSSSGETVESLNSAVTDNAATLRASLASSISSTNSVGPHITGTVTVESPVVDIPTTTTTSTLTATSSTLTSTSTTTSTKTLTSTATTLTSTATTTTASATTTTLTTNTLTMTTLGVTTTASVTTMATTSTTAPGTTQVFTGNCDLALNDTASFWTAYQSDKAVVEDALKAGIASGLPGVAKEDVQITGVREGARRLGGLDFLTAFEEERRLQTGAVTIDYIIRVPTEVATSNGLSASSLPASQTQLQSSLTQAFKTANVPVAVAGVTAPAPAVETVAPPPADTNNGGEEEGAQGSAGPLIGGIIGGALVLICAMAAGVFFMRRGRKEKQLQEELVDEVAAEPDTSNNNITEVVGETDPEATAVAPEVRAAEPEPARGALGTLREEGDEHCSV